MDEGLEDDEFAARLVNYGVKKKRPKPATICYQLNHDCNSKYHIENSQCLMELL